MGFSTERYSELAASWQKYMSVIYEILTTNQDNMRIFILVYWIEMIFFELLFIFKKYVDTIIFYVVVKLFLFFIM